MKRILIFLGLLACTLGVKGQNSAVEQLFARYGDKEGFTTVTISRAMFSLFASETESKDEFNNAVKGLESIRILTPDETIAKGSLNFFREISKSLPAAQYEELMSVKEKDQVFKMLIRKKGNVITEFLMIGGGNENLLIYITGNINLKSISKLSKAMDIEGMDNIEKVGKP
ncbi:MAG: DUF4252 domain-containing protein [Lentimicrobiaceae bacterium]|nr:DUF4252 domain-containing protein [Lentimicrobiaceae bacterium]